MLPNGQPSGSDGRKGRRVDLTAAPICGNQARMAYRFSKASASRLASVHPDLARVARSALATSRVDFMVTEGVRSAERQALLKKQGATRTLKSRHLTGHAIDLAPIVDGRVRWDWPLFRLIADAMKAAAAREGVSIVWGGDWKTFKDGPHFELARSKYPA
jgi:peptidoglycan LD-endopeptidase CwlK